ncbi:hypothetical protein BJX61DRAFT_381810 [Aspergillus egyptiacus]|nr:hypothetical protein BJX61DRAFT_381810 [Aspergillus egyptiacus]
MAVTVDPAIRSVFGPPPPGVDLTASSVAENNGAVIAMFALSVVAIVLRFTARVILRNGLLADDWAIIAALVCIGGSTGLSVAGGTMGGGRHIWAVSLEDLMQLYRLLFSYTFIYASSCTCTRVSILFFYRRIFSPMESWLKIAIGFAWALTFSYPIMIWVTMSTSCRPVSFFWTQFSGTEGTCIDINMFFLAAGIINMLNDVVILIIPFPRLVRLQMTSRKKVGICGIMAVGIFVCVASIVRIHYLNVFMGTADVTWLMGPVFIWSTIEPSVAIICACLPHFAPLARIAHRSVSSYPHSRVPSERAYGYSGMSGSSGPRRGSSMLKRMIRTTDEDEIGLTSYVSVGPAGTKDRSVEAVRQITVQSSFAQDSAARISG